MPDSLPGYDAWLSRDPNHKPVPWASCTVTLSVQVELDCELDRETMQPILPGDDWLDAIEANHWETKVKVVKAEVVAFPWYE
jgi:hypothetical protein